MADLSKKYNEKYNKYKLKLNERQTHIIEKIKNKLYSLKTMKYNLYNISERATENKVLRKIKYLLGGLLAGYSISAISPVIAYLFREDVKKEGFSIDTYTLGSLAYIGTLATLWSLGEYRNIANLFLALNILAPSYYATVKISEKYNLITKTKNTANVLKYWAKIIKKNTKQNLEELFPSKSANL
ncbi:MAG: hypothetical protein CVU81_02060 [Euryarchaeota archaeon HGW-Euryarchaeota-1]|nr:MAG: hypothetical protein CVU81_02060 [Euryarchaeota archaeon HGW-Euryarchaeota-1]